MDIRQIIRNTIQQYLTIGASDIENAILTVLDDFDIADMVQDAIESTLPISLATLVGGILEEEINDSIRNEIENLID